MTQTLTCAATSSAKSRFSLLGRILCLNETYRQRRALARLDAAALDDLGLTRAQANAEANRSFWDVPATWRK